MERAALSFQESAKNREEQSRQGETSCDKSWAAGAQGEQGPKTQGDARVCTSLRRSPVQIGQSGYCSDVIVGPLTPVTRDTGCLLSDPHLDVALY